MPRMSSEREGITDLQKQSLNSDGRVEALQTSKQAWRRSRMQKSGSDHYHTRQSPDDVRFTKPTIDLNFPGQHEFENIYDVLRALEQKTLQPRSLPSLRVFLHDNQLWTIDNKLLYIYRISPKVRRVSVTFISGVKFIERFVNENSQSDLERMASPDFFPEVVRTTNALPAVHSSSSQDCVLLPTVAGFKKMENDRTSAGKANSPGSAKSFSSRSSSSSKTVASRVSSDENDESHLTTGTETNSPYAKLPRTCRVRNDNRTPDSSTNSSVKSYPVQASNNCGSHKKEWDPSPDSSTGQICSEYFGESTSFKFRQSTMEAHFRDLFSKIIKTEEQPQTPLSSSPCFTKAVVECRDIPVSDTLPPVHTLTEPVNCIPRRETALADDHHLVGSKQNINPLQFRQQAESPVSHRSDSPEELSKWREVDTPEAPPDMLGSFSARFSMMNQARSDNKVVTAAEGRGQQRQQQQQQVPTSSQRSSPSKKHAETVSHTSSDSSKDRQSRLDRPLSSCGSSAAPVLERPSTCNFPLDGLKNGPLFRLCTTSIVQPDRTNLSPTKGRSRAFLSAEKKPQGKLSQEHELEVSKKILLRHMKKAFFSVY